LFFKRMTPLDAETLRRVQESLPECEALPGPGACIHRRILRKSHGIGVEGRRPTPQQVGKILGKAREFLRAAETCLPIEDDPDCNAALHEFPWDSGELYVCRAASELYDALLGEGGEYGSDGAGSAYGWDLETNLGLRWLNSQLRALLDKWRVDDW